MTKVQMVQCKWYNKKDASPSVVGTFQLKLKLCLIFFLIHENKQMTAEVQRKLLVEGLEEKDINVVIYQ